MKKSLILSITGAGALAIAGGVALLHNASAESSPSPSPSPAAHGTACSKMGTWHGHQCGFGQRGEMGRSQHSWHRHGGSDHFASGPGLPGTFLNLTDDQKQKAKAIFEGVRPQIEAIRKEEAAKIQAVLEDAGKQLRPILTDSQQKVFDDLQQLRADKAALTPPAK